MPHARSRPARRAITTAILAVVASAAARPAQAQLTYQTFVSQSSIASVLGNNSTIGFAYAGDKFVGSVYFGANNNQLFATDLDGTNVRKFGGVVGIPGSGEMYVSSSLGLGGFAPRNVFSGFENVGSVWQTANDGTSGSLFASGLVGGVRSIAFDPYGLYGYDMIVATNAGYVYRVDMTGHPTPLAFVGEDAEGLSFAPQAFGPYGKGTLVVASEGSGSLRAISPTGALSVITQITGAEMVSFVPTNLGASGSSLEGFYAARYPIDIVKVDYSQFLGYLGHMIVTSETLGRVYDVSWNGTGFVTTAFTGNFPGQPEDGIFVTADIVNSTVPEPATLMLILPGLLGVAGMAGRRKK